MHEQELSGFGAVLKRLRGAAGLTQEALAERARVSVEAISALERGFRKTPHVDTVTLLAAALALSPEQRAELKAAASGRKVHGGLEASQSFSRADAVRDNLPRPPTPLVGRDNEVVAILDALQNNALVTVTGSGGIGKTRAALKVGVKRRECAETVWFVDLSLLEAGNMIPAAIASALGIPLPAEGNTVAALVSALGNQRLLLILDNCEHVLEAVASIAVEFLSGCPGVKILATSRQRLGVAGEVAYRMPPLAVPDDGLAIKVSAEDARCFGAIELFVERAQDAGAGFVLTDANAPLVAEVCRRLDGVALAIELAAARMRMMNLAELRRHLDERFELLTGGVRGTVPHHRTLRATFDWSYDLLEERERGFFRCLGIFVGGFTLEAAQSVGAGEPLGELHMLELLAALVDKSLVVADIETEITRYRMLETTRAYALERLSEAGEHERQADCHLAFYKEFAEGATAELDATGRHTAFVPSLALELDNIRAALRRSLTGGDVETGAALAAAIGWRWLAFGASAEGLTQLEALIRALPDRDAKLLARLWTAVAWLLGNTFHSARACEAAQRAVEYARVYGEPAILIIAFRTLVVFAARVRRFEEAEDALAEAESIAGPNPPLGQLLDLLSARGHVALQRGDYESAARAYETRRKLLRSLDDEHGEATTTIYLAEVEHARGETARAIELVREVLPRADAVLGPELYANMLANLAGYLVRIDDLAGARAAASKAVALLAPANPSSLHITLALEHAALGLALDGELMRAAKLLGYCSAAQNEVGFEPMVTEQITRDRLNAVLRERLDGTQLDTLLSEGAPLTPRRAIQEAFGEIEHGV